VIGLADLPLADRATIAQYGTRSMVRLVVFSPLMMKPLVTFSLTNREKSNLNSLKITLKHQVCGATMVMKADYTDATLVKT